MMFTRAFARHLPALRTVPRLRVPLRVLPRASLHPIRAAPLKRYLTTSTDPEGEPSPKTSNSSSPDDLYKARLTRNRNMLYYVVAAVAAMIGAAYAAVPLYRLFCQVTGLGGTTQRGIFYWNSQTPQWTKTKSRKLSRLENSPSIFKVKLLILFHGLTLCIFSQFRTFEPLQQTIDIFPGETALAFYETANFSDEAIIGEFIAAGADCDRNCNIYGQPTFSW